MVIFTHLGPIMLYCHLSDWLSKAMEYSLLTELWPNEQVAERSPLKIILIIRAQANKEMAELTVLS